MDKEYILNNVFVIDASDLAQAIIKGICTLEELKETENLGYQKRLEIDKIIKNLAAERDQWEAIENSSGKDYYLKFLTLFPNGIYAKEANDRIESIEKLAKEKEKARLELLEEEKAEWEKICESNSLDELNQFIDTYPEGNFINEAKLLIGKFEILENIKNNHNNYSVYEVQEMLDKKEISIEDLKNIDIPESIISKLYNGNNYVNIKPGTAPDSIPDGYTEVYFWGMPGSGKTTALASILSTADREGQMISQPGPGLEYMTKLSNLFSDEVNFLPPANPLNSTQYLPFILKKDSLDRASRSVSLIELSGELFQCFYEKNAGNQLSDSKQVLFDQLVSYLENNNNRKMHFFFIDYGAGSSVDNSLFTQSDYLNAPATFINKSEYEFFNKNTDAIYIVLTKSDLLLNEVHDDLINKTVSNYINKEFSSLVTSLKEICKKHNINDGKLLATHFSLGEVYFNDLCKKNSYTAKNIIDILIRRVSIS